MYLFKVRSPQIWMNLRQEKKTMRVLTIYIHNAVVNLLLQDTLSRRAVSVVFASHLIFVIY